MMIPGERVEFQSGPLALWGEVWRPDEAGPFRTVLWNHGSEGRQQALQAPATDGPTTLDSWLSLGFAVFAPSRRGYDGSDGEPLRDALERTPDGTAERGQVIADRLLAENDDVLAALDYLLTQPWVAPDRIVCAGYSFGGIMTVLGLSRTRRFAAGVNFASAAIVWPRYAAVREMLLDRTAAIVDPLMILQAENDYSVEPSAALSAVLARNGVRHAAKIYPPVGQGPADGHLFCALAGTVWRPDVRRFLEDVGVMPSLGLNLGDVLLRDAGADRGRR